MKEKMKLLIVEDEASILTGLVDVFTYHGYEVDSAAEGKSGLAKALQSRYDLIILDVMLPGVDGFTICAEIRKVSREQPIIILTAKSAEEDIINGLSLGADDYVEKPFSVRELVLRVEAILRRSAKWRRGQATLAIGDMAIDTENLVGTFTDGAKAAGRSEAVHFTRREINLLLYLQDNRARPVHRGELLAEVWGYSKTGSFETRTIDIHIAKIRRKIEPNPDKPIYLVTVRGEGYRLLT
jgi:DNA-binding response OmpR family regulator